MIKWKVSESWWSPFVISNKKIILHFGCGPLWPPFVQIGSKKQFLKRFYQLFFRTTGLKHKLLYLIGSSNIFHFGNLKKAKWVRCGLLGKIWAEFGLVLWKNKETGNGVFSYFAWSIHLKAQSTGYRNTIKWEEFVWLLEILPN